MKLILNISVVAYRFCLFVQDQVNHLEDTSNLGHLLFVCFLPFAFVWGQMLLFLFQTTCAIPLVYHQFAKCVRFACHCKNVYVALTTRYLT